MQQNAAAKDPMGPPFFQISVAHLYWTVCAQCAVDPSAKDSELCKEIILARYSAPEATTLLLIVQLGIFVGVHTVGANRGIANPEIIDYFAIWALDSLTT